MEYTGILLKMKMRKLTGTKRKKDNYAITDLAFFVFFPVLFTIFNILYWTSICWNRLEEQEKYNLWGTGPGGGVQGGGVEGAGDIKPVICEHTLDQEVSMGTQ